MSDQDIKQMAKLLKSGATMLDKACPYCGQILFRLKNANLFCPHCNKAIAPKIEKQSQKNFEKHFNLRENEIDDSENQNVTTFFELNNLFSSYILKLTKKLDSIEDPIYFEKVLVNIDRILDIIKKIRIFNQ
ncbi:MAG: Sjogren's syndrome/scleroderma autoantigen 1 family protein [Promethearchaeota archaeon]